MSRFQRLANETIDQITRDLSVGNAASLRTTDRQMRDAIDRQEHIGSRTYKVRAVSDFDAITANAERLMKKLVVNVRPQTTRELRRVFSAIRRLNKPTCLTLYVDSAKVACKSLPTLLARISDLLTELDCSFAKTSSVIALDAYIDTELSFPLLKKLVVRNDEFWSALMQSGASAPGLATLEFVHASFHGRVDILQEIVGTLECAASLVDLRMTASIMRDTTALSELVEVQRMYVSGVPDAFETHLMANNDLVASLKTMPKLNALTVHSATAGDVIRLKRVKQLTHLHIHRLAIPQGQPRIRLSKLRSLFVDRGPLNLIELLDMKELIKYRQRVFDQFPGMFDLNFPVPSNDKMRAFVIKHAKLEECKIGGTTVDVDRMRTDEAYEYAAV